MLAAEKENVLLFWCLLLNSGAKMKISPNCQIKFKKNLQCQYSETYLIRNTQEKYFPGKDGQEQGPCQCQRGGLQQTLECGGKKYKKPERHNILSGFRWEEHPLEATAAPDVATKFISSCDVCAAASKIIPPQESNAFGSRSPPNDKRENPMQNENPQKA